MGDGSAIEWTRNADGSRGATWNPIVGCEVLSPGCRKCYAMKEAGRQVRMAAGAGRVSAYEGLTVPTKAGPVWTGQVRLVEHRLDEPLRWTRPRVVFVNSMGDLGAPGVPDEWLDLVWNTMELAPRHTFLVLTKRPEALRAFLFRRAARKAEMLGVTVAAALRPFPNIWLGVSAEDQARADDRIPVLLDTPAAVRFVSAEPLLAPINLEPYLIRSPSAAFEAGRVDWTMPRWALIGAFKLDWVIVGGESGPGARPMHPDWARQIRDDCAATGVAFFFKQWGEWLPEGQFDTKGFQWAPGQDGRVHWWRPEPAEGSPLGDGACSIDLGKRRAGRRLDARTHDDRPEIAA